MRKVNRWYTRAATGTLPIRAGRYRAARSALIASAAKAGSSDNRTRKLVVSAVLSACTTKLTHASPDWLWSRRSSGYLSRRLPVTGSGQLRGSSGFASCGGEVGYEAQLLATVTDRRGLCPHMDTIDGVCSHEHVDGTPRQADYRRVRYRCLCQGGRRPQEAGQQREREHRESHPFRRGACCHVKDRA